jgi:hypothetical protein
MSLESGTGTPSSSARRLGAPAKGTAADPLDGGALTLGWTSPTGEQARERRRALLARWPPLSLSAAARVVARSGEERGGEWRKWLGFRRSGRAVVLSPRETCATVDLRWMAHTCLGLFRPRWAERKSAQAFVVFYQSACGLGRTGISRWANFGLKILKCFSSFFRNRNKPV